MFALTTGFTPHDLVVILTAFFAALPGTLTALAALRSARRATVAAASAGEKATAACKQQILFALQDAARHAAHPGPFGSPHVALTAAESAVASALDAAATSALSSSDCSLAGAKGGAA